MRITTLSSHEFNQHASDAQKAANRGPVFITHEGHVTHVLLGVEDYQRLVGDQNIADLLAMPGTEDVELEIPPPRGLRGRLV
jgi:PHD/YefM family antitoxin component YafN of YafNO toxin-antitoxin module